MKFFEIFMVIIMVQLFYGFGITILTYALTKMGVSLNTYQSQFIAQNISSYNVIQQKIQESIAKQTNIPIIDIGALVFYSGNIMIDLFMNFFFAVPSMFSILVNFFLSLFPIDVYLALQLKLVIYGFIAIVYLIMLIQFILGLIKGGGGIV